MEIHLGQILFQVINFGVLVLLLKKFLYKPIVKLLEDRTKKINEGLQAAQASLVAKAQLEELKQQQLISAETAAAQILDEARLKAETAGKTIIDQARAAAQAEVKKEYQILEEKLAHERDSLKADIADLVINTTKTVLLGTLTGEHQQAILTHQLKQLKHLKVKPT